MSKLRENKRKLRQVAKKMQTIRDKYPYIDFSQYATLSDINLYLTLSRNHTYLSVDVEFCASENRLKMCDGCTCWKIAAYNHDNS